MGVPAQEIQHWTWPVVEQFGRPDGADIVLVCEHASAFIPPVFEDLGLSASARTSHIAWDIGARDLALALCDQLGATLLAGAVSRLVYDCNRPLSAPDSIVATSDATVVPGNRELSVADRAARCAAVHDPFHEAIGTALDRAAESAILVTIHSFTGQYLGQVRTLEIGYLWHDDDRLAQAALAEEQRLNTYWTAANEPYSAADGVTYTLARHGSERGLANLMIEVRNDLLGNSDDIDTMADHLASIIRHAQREVRT